MLVSISADGSGKGRAVSYNPGCCVMCPHYGRCIKRKAENLCRKAEKILPQ